MSIALSLPFGKHQGRSVEWVMLKDPGYAYWILNQPNPNRQMAKVCNEVRRLIQIFDAKPFLVRCNNSGCGKAATRGSLYGKGLSVLYWCDDCSLSSAGAWSGNGKLQEICSYVDALQHIDKWHGDRKKPYETLIRDLALAKGLPARAQASQIHAFFNTEA